LGFESAQVTPDYVMEGIAPTDFDDVLSGMTFGWLNRNCALAAQMQVGPGKMLVTTYRFAAYPSDPYARELLNSMIRCLASIESKPRLRFPLVAAMVETG